MVSSPRRNLSYKVLMKSRQNYIYTCKIIYIYIMYMTSRFVVQIRTQENLSYLYDEYLPAFIELVIKEDWEYQIPECITSPIRRWRSLRECLSLRPWQVLLCSLDVRHALQSVNLQQRFSTCGSRPKMVEGRASNNLLIRFYIAIYNHNKITVMK